MLKHWFVILVVVLGLFVLVGVLWYNSDADLRAEDAAMRAAGFPATWAEMPPFVSPPEVIRKVGEVRALAESVGSYEGYENGSYWYSPGPGTPPTAASVTWLASVPPTDAERLQSGIQEIPSASLECRNRYDMFDNNCEVVQDRTLVQYLSLRLALVPREKTLDVFKSMEGVINWSSCRSIIHGLVQWSEEKILIDVTLSREDLDTFKPEIINTFADLQTRNWNFRTKIWTGEYLGMRSTVANCDRDDIALYLGRSPLDKWPFEWSMKSPEWILRWTRKISLRYGRAAFLRNFRQNLLIPIKKASNLREILIISANWESYCSSLSWQPMIM